MLPTPLKLLPREFVQLVGLDKLLIPLNKFASDVLLLLNKRLTIQDNIDGSVITVVVDGQFPVNITWTRLNAPTIVIIGQCKETSGPHTIPSSAISLDWQYTGTNLQINGVPGLSPTKAKTYTLTLMALVG